MATHTTATCLNSADSPRLAELLSLAHRGERHAMAELVSLLYDDLRALASRQLRKRPQRHIQTTVLVHELYIHLVARHKVNWRSRAHFFAACATAMRHILIDAARRTQRQKRGGGLEDLPLLESVVGSHEGRDAEWLLSLNDNLDQLAAHNTDLAHVFELRYFGGYSAAEVAEISDLSKRTVERRWRRACAWLQVLFDPNPQN